MTTQPLDPDTVEVIAKRLDVEAEWSRHSRKGASLWAAQFVRDLVLEQPQPEPPATPTAGANDSTLITITLVERDGTGRGTRTINLPPEIEQDPDAMVGAFVAIDQACVYGLLNQSILGHGLVQCDRCEDLWAGFLVRRVKGTEIGWEFLCPECRKDKR